MGYSDNMIEKLAALLKAEDANPPENRYDWLAGNEEVLIDCVDAITQNADGSFNLDGAHEVAAFNAQYEHGYLVTHGGTQSGGSGGGGDEQPGDRSDDFAAMASHDVGAYLRAQASHGRDSLAGSSTDTFRERTREQFETQTNNYLNARAAGDTAARDRAEAELTQLNQILHPNMTWNRALAYTRLEIRNDDRRRMASGGASNASAENYAGLSAVETIVRERYQAFEDIETERNSFLTAHANGDAQTQADAFENMVALYQSTNPEMSEDAARAHVIARLENVIDPDNLSRDERGQVTLNTGNGGSNTVTPAFDDDGNLMPGVVDPNASAEQQRAQLLAALSRQGITGEHAQSLVNDALAFSGGQQIPGVPAFATGAEAAQYVTDANEGEVVKQLIDEANDFAPGDSRELIASNGSINLDETRISRLRTTLNRFLIVDDPAHIASIRAVLDVHVERYERLEADARAAGNFSLAQDYAYERQMYSDTRAQLGYGSERWRTQQVTDYAFTLAGRGNTPYSLADIQRAAGSFLRGESINGNPVDEYVRTSMLRDNMLLYSAVIAHGDIANLFGQDGVGSNSGVRMPTQETRALNRLGFGAAATNGLQALGNVGVNPNLKPGSTDFGNDMHERIGRMIADKYPGLNFDIRTRPGQTGVDITLLSNKPEDIARVGFQRAEIKPLSESGHRTYERQVQNWGFTPDQVKPITYDARGNVYFGFGQFGRKK
jgi:hypothetical protein